MRYALLLAHIAAPLCPPVFAQATEGPDARDATDPPVDEQEIIITGTVIPGRVVGDIPPEIQLDSGDIAALGAASLPELLEAISSQTSSGRGRGDGGPVVLLNGRRISGQREIRDIPTEAIERVDILPEEVALKYGYRADQRVVNIVLLPSFHAITAEAEASLATDGGRPAYEAEFSLVQISDAGRLTLDAEYEREDALLESERDIIVAAPDDPFDLAGNVTASAGGEIDPALSALHGAPVTVAGLVGAGTRAPSLADFGGEANVTDTRPFRTLIPQGEEFSLNATFSRTIFGNVAASLNAGYDLSRSTSLFGLPSASLAIPAASPFSPFASDVLLHRYFDFPRPLTRRGSGSEAHLGLSLNGDVASWRWSFTAAYDRDRTRTRTDTGLALDSLETRIAAGDADLNPFAIPDSQLLPDTPDRSRSLDQTANAQLVANGSLFSMPAGKVETTLRAGGRVRGFESESISDGTATAAKLSRSEYNGQANLDLPIASRRNGVLAAIGDLSVNANVEIEQLSDFGSLVTYGYGLNWSPIKPVRLVVSFTSEEGAPSVQQLGNPVLLVPNIRVFDFIRGETVDITRIEGGNPGLSADSRRILKVGLTVKPIEDEDLTIRADYNRSRMRDLIASFPTATAEIEAAFPDRFERDVDGRLVSIDTRPVNFAQANSQELRWGFYFSKRLSAPAPASGDRSGEPGGGSARQLRDLGIGRGRRDSEGGRIQLSAFHRWRLQDEVLIRPGVPELDFLNGSAAGSRGGRPRHEIDIQAGVFSQGFGARVFGRWQSATTVSGDADTGSSDLRFSGLATVNLRLFVDLGEQQSLVARHGWLDGMRLSLRVNNLFNSRPRVRDESGATPISYQPAYLDPLGRSLTLSLRKQFS